MSGYQEERYEITVDMEPGDEMNESPVIIDSIQTSEDQHEQANRLKSAVTKRKGRGFTSANEEQHHGLPSVTHFDRLSGETSGKAIRSIEGWVLIVTGLHEEVTEDDLYDVFADIGPVRELKMNLDHRTGYVKGYATVEYESYEFAKKAVDNLNGAAFMDGVISVDFCFIKPQSM